MLFSNFGHDHQKISKISLGGAAISGAGGGYGFGHIDENAAIDLIHYACDCGINLFDTAPIYGFNQSEKILGYALKSMREKIKIVSKAGVSWHENKRVNMTNDPLTCQKMLESSLKNLTTDYIDIYMIHWPDEKIDIRYTLEILQKAKEQQKIVHLGLCNTHQEDLQKAKEVCSIDVIQSEVNLFQDAISELDFQGFKMGWGTFDKGILTGHVTEDRKYDESDCRSWAPWWKKSNWKEKVKKVEMLKEFAFNHNHNLVEISLGYSLSFAAIDSAICGFRNKMQLDVILKALSNLPDLEIISEAKKICE